MYSFLSYPEIYAQNVYESKLIIIKLGGEVYNNSANRLISVFALISFIFTLSCTTTKVHPIHTTLPQEKVRGLKVGDIVKVMTYSGEQYKFKVEKITNEVIEGEGNKIALTDVESIKKVFFTEKGIVAFVVLIVGFVVLIVVGINNNPKYKTTE